MSLEKKSQIPLYVQLMKEIKNQIHDGKYKEGQQIPTEKELSVQYNVSRITVRRTIEELCAQGYLIKQQGKGTFVEFPRIYRKLEQDSTMSFTETCSANGRVPSSHVLSFQSVPIRPATAEFFSVSPESEVHQIRRVLCADDLPMILETIYLPYSKYPDFPKEKLENASFTKLMQEYYGIDETRKGRSTIEVQTASGEMAEYLQIDPGEPVMILRSYFYDAENRPLYVSYEVIVGKRYRISV